MQLRFKVAGISDMGLVRTNNEDNFQIARDLSVEPMRWINNEACLLTPNGALLVVADGMGGMNAGEVASQIAIDTVKEVFSPAALAGVRLGSAANVNAHIAAAVSEADRRIKATAAARPETHGMGTTIVIAWLLDGKLYVGWCGDSRAYIFNAATGLRRLSKDHSYVQTLVDAGKLTEEQAFDYPQSNIITRCLSDSSALAEADVLPEPVTVADGDIILLCTDGLCGMIRDNMIERILRNATPADLTATAKGLVDGALGAGGADNVTVALLQVVSGGAKPAQRVLPAPFGTAAAPGAATPASPAAPRPKGTIPKSWLLVGIIGIVVGIVTTVLVFTLRNNGEDKQTANANKIDLLTGRDSLYNNPAGSQEVTPNPSSDQNGETTSQASQLGNSLGSGLAAIASTFDHHPGNGAATESTDSPTNAGSTEKESSTGASTTKKDSIASAGSPVPYPAKRKVIKIKVGTVLPRTIAKKYKMSEDTLQALNKDVNLNTLKATDSIYVYALPAK